MSAPETNMTHLARRMLSAKAEQFTESVIREMTRLAMKHNAVNLSQGFPDFAAPEEIKEAARQAISDDINQYAITWGAKPLRDAVVEKFARTQHATYDPEREITICCGSTEAMMSAMMAIINPGDEIVVFEPFYENYGPDAILSGATPRFVKMRPPDPQNENSTWSFDERELAAAFGPHTKAIILNTPNNPTGKVFTRQELEFIRDLCVRWNAFCITDEIYEHILYDSTEHISMARIDGMRDRTIVINGMSKTYSVTGWRVGWALAPPETTQAIRKVHDFLTVGAAAPLQQAGALALKSPQSYYDKLAATYTVKRERLLRILTASGFTVYKPCGAYYIMTDISHFHFDEAKYPAASRGAYFAPRKGLRGGRLACVASCGETFQQHQPSHPEPAHFAGEGSAFSFSYLIATQFASLHNISLCYTRAEPGRELHRAPRISANPAWQQTRIQRRRPPLDISETISPTFFCTLTVADQIEQESLEVSIWGSADGQEFRKRPLLKLPQQFYCGTTKMVLDLSLRPEINHLRARWELNRWGRVSPVPMFVASLELMELPPMSRDTPTKRAVLAAQSS